MPLASLINRPCSIRSTDPVPTGEYDDFGNEIFDYVWTDTVCELQQRQRSENDEEISRTAWVAFFFPGERVGTGGVLEVDGVQYQVEGDPWPVRNPRSQAESHIEATVVRVAGAGDGPEGS